MGADLEPIARLMLGPVALNDNRFVINDRGGGAKWFSSLSGSGQNHFIDHYRSRQNARRSMHDTPLARSMVERMADTVADVGLRLELSPDAKLLGITLEEAEAWGKEQSARFHLWASNKKQHRSETLTFYQYQRLYSYLQQRDNDMFTRLYYSNESGLQSRLQFESIDPNQIRGDAFTSSYGMQCGFDGIERDERGREKAYKVYIKNEDGTYQEKTISAVGRSGRIHMLHGFRPEYSGQRRGYTRLAHAIQEFENLTDFSSATIKKAINQSCIVGFVEPSKDEDASNPFEHMLTDAGAGPAAQMFGSQAAADPTPITPSETPGVEGYYRIPEATMDTAGSMFITNLTKGSKMTFAQNSSPGDSFDKFVDSFAGYLSASTGTPLEVVLMKFGQNYSASRATLLLFWRIAIGWRFEMDADLLSPVVEMWLSEEIAAGRTVAPGWSDPRLRAAWLCKNWIGTPAPDIDPVKTAKARRENIEIGVTNMDREARDHNGSSAASNLEKNRALFENYTMPPWLVKQQQKGQVTDNGQAQAALEYLIDLVENGG